MKDTQIFPDFALEYIVPLLTVKYNTMFQHGQEIDSDMIIEEEGQYQASGLLLSLKVNYPVVVLKSINPGEGCCNRSHSILTCSLQLALGFDF